MITKDLKLKDISDVQTGPFGSQLHMSDYVENGTPMITVEHMVNDKINHDENIPKVSFNDAQRLKKFLLQSGDIVYSRVGSVDRSAYVSQSEDGWMFSGRLLRVRVTASEINSLWLYYYLTQETIKRFVRNIAVGATMPSLNTYLLGEIPVSFPDLAKQLKSARILTLLNDQVESNNRRIEILEEMAQLLYREWFVEFRFPGYKKAKFVNSELGKIPGGWLIKPLGALANKKNNSYTDDFSNKPLLDLGRINSKTQIINDIGTPDELTTSRKKFYRNDILFGAIRPYFHKVIYAPFDGVTNTSVFVLNPKVKRALSSYLFSLLNSYESVAWTTTFSSGTKMPIISWSVFRKMKVLQPTEEILENYDKQVRPMLNMITNLTQQNFVLRDARDLLLPKLMSGEIDVSKLDINITKN